VWYADAGAQVREAVTAGTQTGPAARAGGGPLEVIRGHPLIAYFVIACAFTWTYDLLFLVLFWLPDVLGRDTLRDFGPSVAALVVTAVTAGKSGLRRFFQRFLMWRASPVWYVFIFVGVH
jgi:uncharacterized protein